MDAGTEDGVLSPEDLKEQREVRLLEKWGNGDHLSKGQLEEIRHRLPAGLPQQSKASAPGQEHRFKKQRAEYCEIYGVKVRAIDRWLATGRAANLAEQLDENDPKHLPPLDDAALMPAWWSDHMKQRVPPKLLALSAQKSEPPQSSAADSIDVQSLALGDDDEPLQQARRYLAAADLRLRKAYVSGTESEITLCSRVWQTASKTLRDVQAAARATAISAGQYVRIADVGSDLAQFFEMFRNMQSNLPRRLQTRLADLPPEILERVITAVDLESKADQEFLRRLPFLNLESPETTKPVPENVAA